jgi:hypothetical protein
MNSNHIHEGELYAWYQGRPKGVTPWGAAKVRVNRIKKSKYTYEKNRRTEIEVTIVEVGENPHMKYYKEGRNLTVSARDLIDYWEDYHDEMAVVMEERRKRDFEREKAQLRGQILEQMIGIKLAEKGFLGIINVNYNSTSVNLSMDSVKMWLGIFDHDLDQAVVNRLGPSSEVAVPSHPDPADSGSV